MASLLRSAQMPEPKPLSREDRAASSVQAAIRGRNARASDKGKAVAKKVEGQAAKNEDAKKKKQLQPRGEVRSHSQDDEALQDHQHRQPRRQLVRRRPQLGHREDQEQPDVSDRRSVAEDVRQHDCGAPRRRRRIGGEE